MRKLIPALSAAILLLSACSHRALNAENNVNTDVSSSRSAQPIFATMQLPQDSIKTGDKVILKFTVYNTADTVQQFCKWHTPFEPLMSKYLDVTSADGEEANYLGAMAKRIMPPPADSYVKLNPGDSLSVDVDVLKAYAMKRPAQYIIRYNSSNISGLVVKDSVKFVYAP
jgi:hypothetical protein